MAERRGFEPLIQMNRITVFETAAFDRSAISPQKQIHNLACGIEKIKDEPKKILLLHRFDVQTAAFFSQRARVFGAASVRIDFTPDGNAIQTPPEFRRSSFFSFRSEIFHVFLFFTLIFLQSGL